ncbi:hypothetical protein BV25DRAFT_1240998 [Artomyces pyxidatus]|uniref:Uncharacterized protein n=1 Tax=Artomyces pyxidatus TaxID=48021 RepID=A0ACB8SPR5_9AGAM|nr:hypothetical protein BV25DRAFT_1240998 [Artomyces pyxidatus]
MRTVTLKRVLAKHRIQSSSMNYSVSALPGISVPPTPASFDIFDAPHRLGESAKLVGFSPTPPRTSRSSGLQNIRLLPEPVLYDGPSRGNRSRSFSRVATVLPSSLPPAELFDGPARPLHLARIPKSTCAQAPSLTILPIWAMKGLPVFTLVERWRSACLSIMARFERLSSY